MKNNLIIWFIGSNASGKTTQAALLHFWLNGYDRTEPVFVTLENKIKGEKFSYTILSDISANLGKFVHPLILPADTEYKAADCCGTDTVQKKSDIIGSFEEACIQRPIVIVEGIMATGQWIKFLKKDDNEVVLILLDLDLETNLSRLADRRGNKKGILPENVEFNDKTLENISGKVRGFKSLFNRMRGEVDLAFKIDSTKLSISEIQQIIKQKIQDFL